MKEIFWYRKEYAQVIVGVAILLMVAHHFFGFSDYLLPGVSWIPVGKIAGIEVERIVGAFGKICVSLYAFNSGYVMWVNRDDYRRLTYRTSRLLRFLAAYWIVGLLFYLYAMAVGDQNPTGVNLWLVQIGYATGPYEKYVNMAFAWYVTYYIFFVLLANVWLRLLSSNHKGVDLIVVVLAMAALQMTRLIPSSPVDLGFLSPVATGLWGIIAAKWHLFEWMDCRMSHLSKWILAGVIPVAVIIRQGSILVSEHVPQAFGAVTGGVELAVVPLFIYVMVKLTMDCLKLKKALLFLGSVSMNIWFLHGLFFSGHRALQPLLYGPEYSVLVYLWGLLLLVPSAWLVSKLQKYIIKLITRVIYI